MGDTHASRQSKLIGLVPIFFLTAVFALNGPQASLAERPSGRVVGTYLPRIEPGTKFTKVDAGEYYSVLLDNTGKVHVVGDGPLPPSYLSNVVDVAAGRAHILALRADGSVVAWGDNAFGQINVPAGLSNVQAIAAGGGHSLALLNNGELIGWGSDFQGINSSLPGLTNIAAISTHGSHNLALLTDGTVSAWGWNDYGQTNVPPGLNGVIAVAAGGNHSLALRSNGTVVAWGDNYSGQTNVPSGLSNVVAIATGGDGEVGFGAALISDGKVVVWGYGWNGPEANSQSNLVASFTNVSAIAGGKYHGIALTTAGAIYGWGSDYYGEASFPFLITDAVEVASGWLIYAALQKNGNVKGWETPALETLTNLIAIDATHSHCLGLRADATAVGWGDNFADKATVPTELTNVVGVATGSSHSLGVLKDGRVLAWGFSLYGVTNVPPTLNDAIAVAAGETCSLALRSNGMVVAWGAFGVVTNIPPWVNGVGAISAGNVHALALRTNGTVLAWGANNYGQTNVPVGLSNVVAIDAGNYHSLALKNDGTVVCWGGSPWAQNRLTNDFVGLSNIVAISAGLDRSLGIQAPVAITSLNVSNANVLISFYGFSGRNYSIEYKPTLSSNDWATLPGSAAGKGASMLITDTNAIINANRRYYRLREH